MLTVNTVMLQARPSKQLQQQWQLSGPLCSLLQRPMRRMQQLQGAARAWLLLTLTQLSLRASLMLPRPEGHSWSVLQSQQVHLLQPQQLQPQQQPQPRNRQICGSLHREYKHLPAMLGRARTRLLGAPRLQ